MYQQLLDELKASNARLIAVSKTKPADEILQLYDQGHRAFGENRAQEMAAKYEELPKDIEWHFIGHLQTNKVKYIAPFVHMIHSVDRMKVLKEVNKRARQQDRVIDCLLQFHIAEEENKFGFDLQEAEEMLKSDRYQSFENVRILGVMGMATFTEDKHQVRKEFKQLKQYFSNLKEKYFSEKEYFREISMGMSGDYKIALEEGSTMVRIGTLIFGER